MAIKYSSYDATSGNTFALNGLTSVSGIFTSRVGIGVSNPSVSLDIDGGTASEVLRLKSSSSSAAVQQTFIQDTYGYIGGVGSASYWDATLPITDFGISSNSNLNFVTSGTARASITESGKFLIGTTTPIQNPIGVAAFQVVGTDNQSAQIQLSRFSADGDVPRLILTKSRSSTIGTNTIVQNGDVLGRYQFRGADGATSSSYQVAAEILCTVDSIPGSGNMPGRLQLFTTPNGSATAVERLRIDNQGRIGFNTSTLGGSNGAYRFGGSISGSSSSAGVYLTPNIETDVTTAAYCVRTLPATASNSGTPYTIGTIQHYNAAQGTFNADSTVTTQVGFFVGTSLTGATENFGFRTDLNTGTDRWAFYASGNADSYFASNNFIWANGGTERARINSTGVFLVGTSTATTIGGSTLRIQSQSTGGLEGFTSVNWGSGTSGPQIYLAKSQGGAVGTHTAPVAGVTLGRLAFCGSDGISAFNIGAAISAQADVLNFASGSAPSRLVFATSASGQTSPTERMRLNNSGFLILGTAGTAPEARLHVVSTAQFDTTSGRTTAGVLIVNSGGTPASGAYSTAFTLSKIASSRPGAAIASVQTSSDDDQVGLAFLVHNSATTNDVLTESARIDHSGRMLVGTSSDLNLGGTGLIQVAASGSCQSWLARYTADSGAATFRFFKSRGSTVNTQGVVASGDAIGFVDYTASDGASVLRAASVFSEVDGTPATGIMPGRLVFSTTSTTSGASPSERMRIDSSGRVLVGTTSASGTAVMQVAGDVQLQSLNAGQLAGARNRIINGGMAVDARNAGASQTFTAAAALAYSVDRWYGYCTGANVTGQRITGATAGQFYYRFTGAASVTAIGFGQRIEQLNSADLAGTTATLSVDLANSVLTTVTWTAYYATTADAFGTLASPTRTQIATGTFTVTSTVTRYSTNISVPAAATTGIEIVLSVGAQTSGTWTIGNVQLEPGSVATPYERRSYGQELALCQRYYQVVQATTRFWAAGTSQSTSAPLPFQTTMRSAPTAVVGTAASTTNCSATTISRITAYGADSNIANTAAGDSYAVGVPVSLSIEL